MQKKGGYFLVATGFLACPCHLVITLPLALALFGGTALGSFLTQNTALVFGLSAAYFIGALALGLFVLNARTSAGSEECPTCVPDPTAEHGAAKTANRDTPVVTSSHAHPNR